MDLPNTGSLFYFFYDLHDTKTIHDLTRKQKILQVNKIKGLKKRFEIFCSGNVVVGTIN